MKRKLTTSVIFLVLLAVISACGSKNNDDRDPDFLPPVKIQIPDEVKNDPDLVKMIESAEKSINQFSDNIERLAKDGEDVLKKDQEDYTMTDGMKMGKLVMQFMSNSTQMATTIQDFSSYVEKNASRGVIDEKQEKALNKVLEELENRLEEINEKYKDYFDK